jgi:hypothetical protein
MMDQRHRGGIAGEGPGRLPRYTSVSALNDERR